MREIFDVFVFEKSTAPGTEWIVQEQLFAANGTVIDNRL